ncbi:MAG TPA: VTT domain-containing protein [Flavisolibacter sp.]|jgi:membrane-associated protein|nr:VTT domain-containing protein [Flavisolibacter sp.]
MFCTIIDLLFVFGIDVGELLAKYGIWVYAIMFLIIFCETGLVITPILPGDSMIFAAATLSAREDSVLDVHLIVLLLTLAAFGGDVINYTIGSYVGPRVYKKNYRAINQHRLNQTKEYFRKHGIRTIIYARFIPVIRTFAPFVAGVSEMNYKQFIMFNFVGGFSWVAIYAYSGYFLGNIPFVRENFEMTVLVVLIATLLPAIYALVKQKA